MMPRRLMIGGTADSASGIGVPGDAGFGVGVYTDSLPSGFVALSGATDPESANYGNYEFTDGSVMCWVPAFYYRIGHADNPTYAAYGANSVDVQPITAYSSVSAANTAGYALHRAFINGGSAQPGFFADKYQCSNNSGTASSLKNGNPLSSNAAHNPFSGLTGAPDNYYYGAFAAAKTRGTQFHVMSRFQVSALALLALAHAQAATATTYCAWYDAAGTTNFPKGCNDGALGDRDDAAVSYTTDGYSNCGKTGSGDPFAKTTHNGQACGVADLNGNVWEINSGITRPGASAADGAQQNDASAFYILKESVDVNTLTGGWNDAGGSGAATDAFGDATHLATLYDAITLSQIDNSTGWQRFGNSAAPTTAVLDGATSGDGYKQTGAGIYTAAGHDASGIALFGADGLYEYHCANLCPLSGGYWSGSAAGMWALYLLMSRLVNYATVGLRAASYPA